MEMIMKKNAFLWNLRFCNNDASDIAYHFVTNQTNSTEITIALIKRNAEYLVFRGSTVQYNHLSFCFFIVSSSSCSWTEISLNITVRLTQPPPKRADVILELSLRFLEAHASLEKGMSVTQSVCLLSVTLLRSSSKVLRFSFLQNSTKFSKISLKIL